MGVTVQDADAGDTTTMVDTLIEAAVKSPRWTALGTVGRQGVSQQRDDRRPDGRSLIKPTKAVYACAPWMRPGAFPATIRRRFRLAATSCL